MLCRSQFQPSGKGESSFEQRSASPLIRLGWLPIDFVICTWTTEALGNCASHAFTTTTCCGPHRLSCHWITIVSLIVSAVIAHCVSREEASFCAVIFSHHCNRRKLNECRSSHDGFRCLSSFGHWALAGNQSHTLHNRLHINKSSALVR